MKKYYEAYDERYKTIHNQNKQWFSNIPTPIVEETLKRYNITHNHELLELGCGEGRDAFYLLNQGYNLLATDISKEAIEYAKRIQYKDSFQVLDCLNESLNKKFDFIYAIALVHMLVLNDDRNKMYNFISNHLKEDGVGLILSMGDGKEEYESDISKAYDIVKKQCVDEDVYVTHTSCKVVSLETWKKELENYFVIEEMGKTSIPQEFSHMIYAIVRKKE